MDGIRKYVTCGIIIVTGALAATGAYAKFWEYGQPKQNIDNAKVLSIKPYSVTNDLHWDAHGYRMEIEGENRIIDVPINNWDETVKVGDSVDMVVRRSFFNNELDCLAVDDKK